MKYGESSIQSTRNKMIDDTLIYLFHCYAINFLNISGTVMTEMLSKHLLLFYFLYFFFLFEV